jgi:hypothetical protein
MLRRACGLVLLVLVGAATPAQGQVKLAWKFDDKKPFWVLNRTTLKMTIDVPGMSGIMRQEVTNFTLAKFEVVEKQGDNTVLKQTIEEIKVKNATGGFAPGADKAAEQIKGLAFTITLDGKGHVVKIAGLDALLGKFAANDDAAKLLRQTLSEDALKRGAEEAFGFLPDKAVEKGQKWERQAPLPMGPIGTFKTTTTYLYKGKASDGEEIGVEATLTWTPPTKAEAGADQTFKLLKGDLKAESARGAIIFDAAAGRLVRSTLHMMLRGSMTMEVGGSPLPMELTQEQTSVLVVSDKKPTIE